MCMAHLAEVSKYSGPERPASPPPPAAIVCWARKSTLSYGETRMGQRNTAE